MFCCQHNHYEPSAEGDYGFEVDGARITYGRGVIGELGAAWGLADVAFVGGSLDGRRGGQNMIEPAAYGAAVLFGPHVWNFRDTAARLLQGGAAVQVADAAALERAAVWLLGDARARSRLGTAARAFVLSQQGATERTLEHLDRLLTLPRSRAA